MEEVNASASELSSMAARLQELVGQFRLESEDGHKSVVQRRSISLCVMVTTKARKAA